MMTRDKGLFMKKNILLLSTLLITASLNGMLVTRAAKSTSKRRTPQRRAISFVPSNHNPDLLVEFYRDFTPKELQNSSHIKVINPTVSKEPLIVKFDNPSKEEEIFRNAPENSCISFVKSYNHLSLLGRIIAFCTELNVYYDSVNFAHKDSIMKMVKVLQKSYLPKEEIEGQLQKIAKQCQSLYKE